MSNVSISLNDVFSYQSDNLKDVADNYGIEDMDLSKLFMAYVDQGLDGAISEAIRNAKEKDSEVEVDRVDYDFPTDKLGEIMRGRFLKMLPAIPSDVPAMTQLLSETEDRLIEEQNYL